MTDNDLFTSQGAKQLVDRMGEATIQFLASLAADQQRKAVLPFENQEARTEWHYTPTARNGLPFAEMDRTQQRLAQRLITTGLSRAGYVTASTIMGLETALDAIEGWATELWWRDSRLYHLTIFGQPDAKEPWGWRFEGHHISLNYTIVGGQIVAPTPTFFGSNPAESPLGQTSWLRPLGAVEDLGRELVSALDAEQRHQAIVTELAPPDIVSLNRPAIVNNMLPTRTSDHPAKPLGTTEAHLEAVRYTTQPKGIAGADMSADQRAILFSLVGEYLHRMPDELAEIELNKIQQQGLDSIYFVWAGPIERHAAHYYRLQGTRFLVEYDNIQNDANHIHSVWRDAANDFGADILKQHYAHSH